MMLAADGDPHALPGDADVVRASGLVFVLSGPSGVGKSTLIELLKQDGFPITYCVTATTRPRRANEVHGSHYYFLSRDQFTLLLDEGKLLEHAFVHDSHFYGIPLFSVREGLRQGRDLIMTPEVQGAATIRSMLPGVISIFLRPQRIEDLPERISRRGADEQELMRRMATAREELEHISEYDYVVVNRPGRLLEAVDDVKSIIAAERLRTNPHLVVV
ncbi:MAG: guanylate kinase [Chloroflexi bacterium]|nr:guanylate kinase [Chloroflexota bacterium]